MTGPSRENRLVFLDNIRHFIIFFVILQHVALVFMGHGGGRVTRDVFQIIVSITDVFMMPAMFFVAGYFALRSIERHGAAVFVAGKFTRIWLPWLAGVLLLIPVSIWCMYLIRMAARGEAPMHYLAYWLNFMRDAASFHTGYIASADSFSHRHLWFLSNLFVFFLVFAGIWEIRGRMTRNSEKRPEGKPLPPLMVMVLATVISGAAFFAASLLFTWGYRAILVANLIHFEPSRLMFYIVYFAMGIYACSRGWFDGNARLGGPKVWIVLCVVLLAAYSYMILFAPFDVPAWAKLLVSMFRSALCIAVFGALMTAGFAHWNRPDPVDGFLARNAYTVYIIHYPVNAALAVAMISLAAPVMVKAAVLYILTAVLSYVASEYIVRRHIGLSVAAAVLVNVVMMVVL